MIEGEEVVSETESEYQGPVTIASQPLLSEERKQEIQAARRAIRQRAKRIAAKERASQRVLKRRIPKRVSKVIRQHPTIGKDIEERGTQREYSSKPHKHSIVERTLVFTR